MFGRLLASVCLSLIAMHAFGWADTPDFSYATSPGFSIPGTRPAHFIFDIGYQAGGDTIPSGTSNSSIATNSDQSNRAGSGFWLMGGAELSIAKHWALQTTFGYLFDRSGLLGHRQDKNGTSNFDRYPFEFLPLFSINKFQFGVGATYHIHAVANGGGAAQKIIFNDALGWVAEANYRVFKHSRIGLHYTNIHYNLKSNENGMLPTATSVDGSGLGIHFTGVF